jgi:hypothetical protein
MNGQAQQAMTKAVKEDLKKVFLPSFFIMCKIMAVCNRYYFA